jgi:hypothetical protein
MFSKFQNSFQLYTVYVARTFVIHVLCLLPVFQEALDGKVDELQIAVGEEEESFRRAKFDYNVS